MTPNSTHDDGCTMRAGGSQRSISRCIRSHLTRPFWLRRDNAWCQWRLTSSRNRLMARQLPGDPVVLAVAAYHRSQPGAHLGDWVVPAPPQLGFHLFELASQTIARGVPTHREFPFPGPSTTVDQAQKLEALRLLLPALPSVLRGVPPKFQQARFVRVQRQTKLPEPLP